MLFALSAECIRACPANMLWATAAAPGPTCSLCSSRRKPLKGASNTVTYKTRVKLRHIRWGGGGQTQRCVLCGSTHTKFKGRQTSSVGMAVRTQLASMPGGAGGWELPARLLLGGCIYHVNIHQTIYTGNLRPFVDVNDIYNVDHILKNLSHTRLHP